MNQQKTPKQENQMTETKKTGAGLIHWADNTADRIIRQRGDKDEYIVASGITPSGVVHFGNFREVITVDLVARALRKRGKKVRFIFSWDNYDTFRKIPQNMPKKDLLEKYLYCPIVDTPDPFDEKESYAHYHQANFERQLFKVGINAEFLYQASKYRAGDYQKSIALVLEKRDAIKAILDKHRSSPLADDWLPVLVYCSDCNRDRIENMSYNADAKTISYECSLCQHKGLEDIATSKRLKLPWRIDWPMRWAYEGVDFEPGGKDHSSEGGSYTTAKEIVKEVFDHEPPVYLQYDFVSIKGRGGKMSSSSGDVITVDDVLNIYTPEMVRWIFASYKSNVDFAISFDLDVISSFESFDRYERLALKVDSGNAKKLAMAERTWELSQVDENLELNAYEKIGPSFRPPFRHLTNVLQIVELSKEMTLSSYQNEIKDERDKTAFFERCDKAIFWIKNFAGDDFKFSLNEEVNLEKIDFSKEVLEKKKEKDFLGKLFDIFSNEWSNFSTEKDLYNRLYECIHEFELEPKIAFKLIYNIMICREKGPKLANFLWTVGQKKVARLFASFSS